MSSSPSKIDTIHQKMAEFLSKHEEKAGQWKCSWCDYVNIRHHTGVDSCSACGSAALTSWTGTENEIKVRYSFAPPPKRHLDAVGFSISPGASAQKGKATTETTDG